MRRRRLRGLPRKQGLGGGPVWRRGKHGWWEKVLESRALSAPLMLEVTCFDLGRGHGYTFPSNEVKGVGIYAGALTSAVPTTAGGGSEQEGLSHGLQRNLGSSRGTPRPTLTRAPLGHSQQVHLAGQLPPGPLLTLA